MMKKYKLPFSTSCDDRPEIYYENNKLTLSFEVNDLHRGGITKLSFYPALGFSFTPDTMISGDMIAAYSAICEYENLDLFPIYKGMLEHKLNSNFKHFRLYFDHHGCVVVLAHGWKIEQNPLLEEE